MTVCSSPRIKTFRPRSSALKGFKRIEDALPTLLPVSKHIFTTGLGLITKLHITIAIGLFAVSSQEVGLSAKACCRQVLHDHGNAVCLFIEGDENSSRLS